MHHYKIICIALPNKVHGQMPMYFKKGLNELESEWSSHKKIINIERRRGGIRK